MTQSAIISTNVMLMYASVSGFSGRARFYNLEPGYHRVRIAARATTGELHVLRRTMFICM